MNVSMNYDEEFDAGLPKPLALKHRFIKDADREGPNVSSG